MIENAKEDFKKYIKSYLNGNFVNLEDDIKIAIIEALLKPFIQKMILFFHFCDCVILNYNMEYPDYCQQMNLNLMSSIFNEKVNLRNINENSNPELLFIYEDNNYVKFAPKIYAPSKVNVIPKQNKNKNGKLILDKIKKDYKYH